MGCPNPKGMSPATIPGGCVRRAWLVLGSSSIQLENYAAGYFCTSLDLGTPDVRAVTSSLPDRDGTYDGTRFMGARAVTAAISAINGAGAQIDAVAASFGPYMAPNVRPVLHYVLDRPGAVERTMTLRPAGYAWKVEGDAERDIQLSWVAPDPLAYDPTQKTATGWTGYGSAGRTYNRTYPLAYPAGSVAPSSAVIQSPGDVGVRPLLRIFGPITAATLNGFITATPSRYWSFVFLPSFTIAAGQYVDIDNAGRTVRIAGDPARSVLASVDWTQSSWLYVPPAPASASISMSGGSTSAITQVEALWQDGYLS